MLFMMKQEKKLILLYNYFLYDEYIGATEKTHSFKIIIFLYPVYGRGREKTQTHSVITLFFLYGL